MRGRITGVERNGATYLLKIRKENETDGNIPMSHEELYRILENKGNFIGKDIYYFDEGFRFLEDLKAS